MPEAGLEPAQNLGMTTSRRAQVLRRVSPCGARWPPRGQPFGRDCALSRACWPHGRPIDDSTSGCLRSNSWQASTSFRSPFGVPLHRAAEALTLRFGRPPLDRRFHRSSSESGPIHLSISGGEHLTMPMGRRWERCSKLRTEVPRRTSSVWRQCQV